MGAGSPLPSSPRGWFIDAVARAGGGPPRGPVRALKRMQRLFPFDRAVS